MRRVLDPIEEDLYNNASTPDDYNALGLNLSDCLEDTDWIVLPDKDPLDPDSWINVNHCDTCDHDLPAHRRRLADTHRPAGTTPAFRPEVTATLLQADPRNNHAGACLFISRNRSQIRKPFSLAFLRHGMIPITGDTARQLQAGDGSPVSQPDLALRGTLRVDSHLRDTVISVIGIIA